MRILLLGGTGLIGSRLAQVLVQSGHDLVLGLRNAAGRGEANRNPRHRAIQADFAHDHDPAVWLPRLAGIDAVVNAVGIISESPGQSFEAIHVRAPAALFRACAQARVGRVVQISALGADEAACSPYHRSKHAADQVLLATGVPAVVVQPSLVFAPGGASTGLFAALAALPLLPVPGQGRQCVQPVHLDDLCSLVLACLEHPDPPRRLAAVGPEPLELQDYLLRLRRLMDLAPAPVLPVPRPLVRIGSRLGGVLPGPPVDAEMLGMLERGACGDPRPMTRLLGHPPRAVDAFDPERAMPSLALTARLAWLLPLMRLSLAVMWIFTGVVSLGLYPVGQSLALLARTGLHGVAALVALYLAATLDIALGVATVALRRRLWVYRAQLALIAGYTLLITVFLPEYWLHPYGPILKNLPVLALILTLHELDEGRRWNT
ncbi:SDR family oxidoreductase [Lysobacter sp. GX 14042]|uniref:SDR family oxidoreductase n=1 Tax=Lysobacter sp. GX 14042 TaxID=2907155 RepID=UPI001F15799A|nr:SDR family oxidoreductase [Lysobacter sp. GX 14042]MCE7031493.1 SDR family oxidoreductase [Lysobacter sp. GX 14042]